MKMKCVCGGNHEWDRKKGVKTQGYYKMKTIRTCQKCGYQEEWNEGPVFFGWYSIN